MDDSLILHLTQLGIATLKPRRDAWTNLSLYESRDLVGRLLQERHGQSPDASRSREVATHMTQGRQYFEAAAEAAALAKPLLVYYGVLALSRAVVLCSDVSLWKSTPSSGHGLKGVDWSNRLSSGLHGLPNLTVKDIKGTFTELAEATMNRERSLVFSPARLRVPFVRDGTSSFRDSTTSLEVSLRAALSRIPDLASLFQTTFGKIPSCHPAYIRAFDDVQTSYYLLETRLGIPPGDRIRTAFGLNDEISLDERQSDPWVGKVSGLDFYISRANHSEEMWNLTIQVANDSRTVPYIVEPLPGDFRLSSLSLLFIVAYIMGMLVRYYPTTWASLIGGEPGDSMLPLLIAAGRLIEHKFPELVLEEIEQRHPGDQIYHYPIG